MVFVFSTYYQVLPKRFKVQKEVSIHPVFFFLNIIILLDKINRFCNTFNQTNKVLNTYFKTWIVNVSKKYLEIIRFVTTMFRYLYYFYYLHNSNICFNSHYFYLGINIVVCVDYSSGRTFIMMFIN